MRTTVLAVSTALLLLTGVTQAGAVPIRGLANLTAVRVYEITFSTIATDFAPNSAAITTRLADPLSEVNRDFSFFPTELYDVFYSNAAGAPNPDGDHLTIEGVWRIGGPGGMNINEVELRFFGGAVVDGGDFVASFEYGFGNVNVGSEALAVDGNLATFPRFGQTSATDLNDRFRLTIGFTGISGVPGPGPGPDPGPSPVPSPATLFLLVSGVAGLAARRGFRHPAQAALLNSEHAPAA